MTTTKDYRVPDARLILPASAPRDEWLAMRTRGLGGSDLAVIAGGARYEGTNPYTIWCDKTSDEPPVEQDKDIFWFGHESEDMLSRRFTKDTGIATRACGMYQSKHWDFLLANPDRLTADGGILEIKTTTRLAQAGKDYLAGVIPLPHLVQVVTYMLVTGRRHGYIIALVDRSPVILRVDWDQALADLIVAEGRKFWKHVEDLTAPPIDPYTADASEIAARFPAEVVEADAKVEADFPDMAVDDYERLATLKADASYIKEQIAVVEDRVKAQIGDREFLTANGRPLFRWQPIAGRRSFDKTAVLSKLAAERGVEPTKAALKQIEDEYTKTGAPTRRLTPIKQSGVAA